MNDWIAPQQAGAGPMWNPGLQGLDDWTAPTKKAPAPETAADFSTPGKFLSGLLGEWNKAAEGPKSAADAAEWLRNRRGNFNGPAAILDPFSAVSQGEVSLGSLSDAARHMFASRLGTREVPADYDFNKAQTAERNALQQFQEQNPYTHHMISALMEGGASMPYGVFGSPTLGSEAPRAAVPHSEITSFIDAMRAKPNERFLLAPPDEVAKAATPEPKAAAAPQPAPSTPEEITSFIDKMRQTAPEGARVDPNDWVHATKTEETPAAPTPQPEAHATKFAPDLFSQSPATPAQVETKSNRIMNPDEAKALFGDLDFVDLASELQKAKSLETAASAQPQATAPTTAAPMTADELRAKIAEHYPEVLDRIKEIDARRAAEEAQKAAPTPQEAPRAAEPVAPVQPSPVEAKPAVAAPEAPQIEQRAPKPAQSRKMTPESGQDLLGFIRARGGLKPNSEYSADVKAARLIRKNGLTPEQMRQEIIAAGYIREDPNAPPTTSVSDYHDLVNRAAGGERIISEKGQAAEQERIAKEEAKIERAKLEEAARDHIADLDPTGEYGVADQYNGLSRAEKLEFQERVAAGEDGGDILENLAVRRNNDLSAVSEREIRDLNRHYYIPGFDDETPTARAPNPREENAGVGAKVNNTGREATPSGHGGDVRMRGETGGTPSEETAREIPRITPAEASRNYPLSLGEDVKAPLKGVRGKYPDISKVPKEAKGDKPTYYDFLHHAIQNGIPVKLNYGGKERIGTPHRIGTVSEAQGSGMRLHLYQTGGEISEGKNGSRQLKEGEGRWGHFNLSPTGTIDQIKKGATVDPSKQITDLDYAPLGTPFTIPKNAHNIQSGIKVIHTQIPYAEDEVHGGKMLAVRADPDARQHAVSQIAAGRKVNTPKSVLSLVHKEMQPFVNAIPEGVGFGALKSLERGDLPGEIVATFHHPDGSAFTLSVDRDTVFGARAFFDHDTRTLVSFRLGSLSTGSEKGVAGRAGQENMAARTIRAELAHELVHAVWQDLPIGVKKALVSHSDSLGIMDRSWGEYLKTIGEPSWEYAEPGTVRDVYDEQYGDLPDRLRKDAMLQEAATHLMELYQHDALSGEQIAPVKDILDGIMSGGYSGKGAPKEAQAKAAAATAEKQAVANTAENGKISGMDITDTPGFKKLFAGDPDQIINASASNRGSLSLGGKESATEKPVDQTQTPAFKGWFKQSVVTDESGKPMVVYHGGPGSNPYLGGGKGSIEEFRPNSEGLIFATDKPELAGDYAMERYPNRAASYPVYMSMQNPLMVDRSVDHASHRSLVARAKEGSHDGIILKNADDSVTGRSDRGTGTVYIAFDPKQIKSAIGNRGTFNPEDPRITYALGGMRGAEKGGGLEPVPPQPEQAPPGRLPIAPIVQSGPNQQKQDIQALMRQFASEGQKHFATQFPQWTTTLQDRPVTMGAKDDWTPPLPAKKPAKSRQTPRARAGAKVPPFKTRTVSNARVNQRQQGSTSPLDLVGALLHALSSSQLGRYL